MLICFWSFLSSKSGIQHMLWQGDDEFKPRMSVLFDSSIQKTLAADAIWGLVSLVSYLLLKGADYLMNNGHPSK